MSARDSILSVLFSASFVFAITIEDAEKGRLPNPIEIEKQGIERKYEGRPAPTPTPVEGQAIRQQVVVPPPVLDYKIDRNALKRTQLTIAYGTRVQNQNPQAGQQQQSQPQLPQQNQQSQQAKKAVLKGYCKIPYQIEMSIEPEFVQTECLVNRRNIVPAEIRLEPVIAEYAVKAVVESIDGKKANTIRVLNGDMRSENIADYVDRRLIANIILTATRDTGRQTSQAISNIFRTAGRITTTTAPIPGGVGSFTTVDPTPMLERIPKMAMYLAIANLIGATANELLMDKSRLPPIFTINSKDIYIEAEVVE